MHLSSPLLSRLAYPQGLFLPQRFRRLKISLFGRGLVGFFCSSFEKPPPYSQSPFPSVIGSALGLKSRSHAFLSRDNSSQLFFPLDPFHLLLRPPPRTSLPPILLRAIFFLTYPALVPPFSFSLLVSDTPSWSFPCRVSLMSVVLPFDAPLPHANSPLAILKYSPPFLNPSS